MYAWLLEHGYEVFRNICNHGLVDVVASKDGEFFAFDVKSCSTSKLSYEQIAAEIKAFYVSPSGECHIDWDPKPSGRRNCFHCKKTTPPPVLVR